jgi:predicted protein tyrosine phosphatase
VVPTDGPGVPIGERRKLKPFLEVAGPIGGIAATAFVPDARPNHDAENSLTAEMVSRVEGAAEQAPASNPGGSCRQERDLFDVMNSFEFMQPELVRLLATTVSSHLPACAMKTEKQSNLEHELAAICGKRVG